jgi:hypothetical protein
MNMLFRATPDLQPNHLPCEKIPDALAGITILMLGKVVT